MFPCIGVVGLQFEYFFERTARAVQSEIAHELNNPVGAINGAVDVIGRGLERIEEILQDGESDGKSVEQLERILKFLRENNLNTLTAGDRVALIVKNLRNFAQLDEAEYQRVDIHDVFMTIRVCPDRPLLCQPAGSHVLLSTLARHWGYSRACHGRTWSQDRPHRSLASF